MKNKKIKAWAVIKDDIKDDWIYYCKEEVDGIVIFPFATYDSKDEAKRKLSELVKGYKVVPVEITIKTNA